MICIDSNILIYAFNIDSKFYEKAKNVLAKEVNELFKLIALFFSGLSFATFLYSGLIEDYQKLCDSYSSTLRESLDLLKKIREK